MLTRIREIVAAPVFENKEKTRVAGLLNAILLILAAMTLVIVPSFVIIDPATAMFNLSIGAAMVVMALGLKFIMRRGYLRTASMLLVSFLLAVVTVAIYVFGGIRNSVASAYMLVVAIAALLLSGRAAVIFGLLSMLAALGVFYAEISGAIVFPMTVSVEFVHWVLLSAVLGMGTLLLRYAVRSITAGFDQARQEITERKAAEEALQESEEKYRTILENIEDGYYEVDIAGNFTFFNDALCRIFGYPADELMGMNERQLVDDETARAVYQTFNAVYRTGKPVKALEHEFIRKDGARRSVEVSASLMRGPTGEPVGFRGIIRDITERKRVEEKIEHLNLVLRAIRDVNQLITREKDRDRLLQGICETLIETRGYHTAWIALLDESGGIVTSAEAGLGQDFLPLVEQLERGELTDCGQRALKQSGAVVTQAPFSTCADCPLSSTYDGRGAMTVRLEHGGKVYGLLSVSIPRDLVADEEEQGLFEEIAGDIAFALHNVELEEAAKRRVAQAVLVYEVGQRVSSKLELGDLLSEIVTAVRDAFDYYGVMILLVDEEANCLTMQSIAGGYADIFPRDLYHAIGEGMTGYAAASGETQVSGDVSQDLHYVREADEETKSELAVPVKSGQKVIGVLDIQSDEFDAFDETDVMLMETLADQIAGAIENARLYEAVQQELTEREAAEEALRVSEERFALAVRGANDGIWDWDIVSNTLYWSPRMKEMLGYADDELHVDFDTFQTLLHPDDAEFTQVARETHLKAQGPYEIEHRLRTKSGEYRWFLTRGQAVWDEDGQPIRMVGATTDITERKRTEEQLAYMATHDALTGLPNRWLLNDRLTLELARAHRHQQKLALMLLDLDYFKDVNDTLGHTAGDKLLQAVGERLTSLVRKSDTIARMGGDEFMLILLFPRIREDGDAAKIAQRILEAFRKPFVFDDHEICITASIGIAIYPDDGQDTDTLMKNADIAMYRAKAQGRDNYQRYTPGYER